MKRWKYQRYLQDYLACVQSIDDNVGRLLDLLDKDGLSSNTVVIYTSDQGFFLGEHGLYDKRFMYEESIHMPFLIRWPAAIKPGTTQAAMAMNIDFAPPSWKWPDWRCLPTCRAAACVPLLKGQRPADWRKS